MSVLGVLKKWGCWDEGESWPFQSHCAEQQLGTYGPVWQLL